MTTLDDANKAAATSPSGYVTFFMNGELWELTREHNPATWHGGWHYIRNLLAEPGGVLPHMKDFRMYRWNESRQKWGRVWFWADPFSRWKCHQLKECDNLLMVHKYLVRETFKDRADELATWGKMTVQPS